MFKDAMAVATIPVTDLEKSLPFYRDVLGLAVLDEGPFATTNSIANYAPGIRGAWFKDPDGNVLGLREGPQFGDW